MFKVTINQGIVVYSGYSQTEAHQAFYEYVNRSRKNIGKSAGEKVFMFENEKVIGMYVPEWLKYENSEI